MKTLYWAYFLMLFLFTNSIYGQDYSALKNQFANSTVLPSIHYGFSLFDLDRNEPVLGIHEHHYFTPASNTKVFTLFSSLQFIGDSIPGIQYQIKGDSLLFWGTGDPTFLHPKLDNRIVYDFLKSTNKKLFYVSEETSEPSYRNGWSIEDFQEYYQPDITPFPIYGNTIQFYTLNDSVRSIPSFFEATIRRNNTTNNSTNINRDKNTNTFHVHSRKLPIDYKNEKPFIWSDTLLVKLLQDTLHKDVGLLKDYVKPRDLKVLYSVPRNVVLRAMMLPSDNFLAEQLTMLISNNRYNGFFTDRLRYDMTNEFYNNFQDSIILRDGSGLSTYNKITPSSMIELLLVLNNLVPNEAKRYLFFPAGGVDGTLKTVYNLDQGEPFIFAKTGTINSVHCQSGYIVTRSGKHFAFSFLNNNYIVPTSVIRNEMVKIMTFIRHNY